MCPPTFELSYMRASSQRTRSFYFVCILFIIVCLCLLPFLYIDVGFHAQGILQGALQKTDLVVISSGKLASSSLKENAPVDRGQILLQLEVKANRDQRLLISDRENEIRKHIRDLEILMQIQTDSAVSPKKLADIKTAVHRSQWRLYAQQLTQQQQQVRSEKLKYDRYRQLYIKNVISRQEFESYYFSYIKAQNDKTILSHSFKAQCAAEISTYQKNLSELREAAAIYDEKNQTAVLKAPLKGRLHQIIPLYPGVFIDGPKKVGELIPESPMMAYCYIDARKLTWVRKGQRVWLYPDSYLPFPGKRILAKVTDIDRNTMHINGVSVFKVACLLLAKEADRSQKESLMQGMPCRAYFVLSRRSLLQLLRERVIDWLNPKPIAA